MKGGTPFTRGCSRKGGRALDPRCLRILKGLGPLRGLRAAIPCVGMTFNSLFLNWKGFLFVIAIAEGVSKLNLSRL